MESEQTRVAEELYEQVARIFDLCDTDKDGVVTKAELLLALEGHEEVIASFGTLQLWESFIGGEWRLLNDAAQLQIRRWTRGGNEASFQVQMEGQDWTLDVSRKQLVATGLDKCSVREIRPCPFNAIDIFRKMDVDGNKHLDFEEMLQYFHEAQKQEVGWVRIAAEAEDEADREVRELSYVSSPILAQGSPRTRQRASWGAPRAYLALGGFQRANKGASWGAARGYMAFNGFIRKRDPTDDMEEEVEVQDPGDNPTKMQKLATLRMGTRALCERPVDETWPQFVERSRGFLTEDSPKTLFQSFVQEYDVSKAYAQFALTFEACRDDAGRLSPADWSQASGRFPFQVMRDTLKGLPHKLQELFHLFEKRASLSDFVTNGTRFCQGGRLAGRHCVVVGCGPVGFRAAIELRLLGARVTIVDKRETFSRINILHLWEWTGDDLKGLGAKVFSPPTGLFGADPSLLHSGINEIQSLLMKVSLLLGVEVLFGVKFVKLEARASGARVYLEPASTGAPPSPVGAKEIDGVGVLLAANGFTGKAGLMPIVGLAGMESIPMGFKSQPRIGLIANFRPTGGVEERRLRSFALAKQFFRRKFAEAYESTGAALENVVYVKGEGTHYCVMTVSKESLLATGVLLEERSGSELLASSNVDTAKLDALARALLSLRWVSYAPPVLPTLEFDLGGESVENVIPTGLFDFSRQFRAQPAFAVQGKGSGAFCLAPIGDALIEPFWPQGLGVIRGFLGALDACAAVKRWSCGEDPERIVADHAAANNQLQNLNAESRQKILKDNFKTYGLMPQTRYKQL